METVADVSPQFAAFVGARKIASGDLVLLLGLVKRYFDRRPDAQILIFEDATGQQVDFDFRGTVDDVIARAAPPPAGPGRPKLGVICREISLLPRHWDWLEEQPRGASAALRSLVDEARMREPTRAQSRRRRDAAGKFMWAIAGNLPHFEEATRALFADDRERLTTLIAKWPVGIRGHIEHLLGGTN